MPPRPLVLLVDGHAHTLAYALALSATGFNVVPAKNGAEAFTRAWQTHRDIIVRPDALAEGLRQVLDRRARPAAGR